jgi:hypothetical protein
VRPRWRSCSHGIAGRRATLQEVDGATARIGFEANVDELSRVPVADGRRRLSIDMPSLGDATGLAPERPIACDAGYAVMAWVRDASGLHALAGAQGRWAMSDRGE